MNHIINAAVESETTAGTAAPTTAPHASPHRQPTHEETATQAYLIYLGRGAQDGRDLDDWLEAEQMLKARGTARSGEESAASDQYESADLEERTPG